MGTATEPAGQRFETRLVSPERAATLLAYVDFGTGDHDVAGSLHRGQSCARGWSPNTGRRTTPRRGATVTPFGARFGAGPRCGRGVSARYPAAPRADVGGRESARRSASRQRTGVPVGGHAGSFGTGGTRSRSRTFEDGFGRSPAECAFAGDSRTCGRNFGGVWRRARFLAAAHERSARSAATSYSN